MADPARARRVAERVKIIVAEMLEQRIKDERLGFVTVTDVRMTGDLQHASVFYTVFGTEQEQADSEAAIQTARGRIRSAVGKGIGLRLTPTIEFVRDAIPEGAAHVEALIAQAKEHDARVAAAAAAATPAGDPDPYRTRAADEDADENPADDPDQDPDGDTDGRPGA